MFAPPPPPFSGFLSSFLPICLHSLFSFFYCLLFSASPTPSPRLLLLCIISYFILTLSVKFKLVLLFHGILLSLALPLVLFLLSLYTLCCCRFVPLLSFCASLLSIYSWCKTNLFIETRWPESLVHSQSRDLRSSG